MKRKRPAPRLDAAALADAFYDASDLAANARVAESRQLLHRMLAQPPTCDEIDGTATADETIPPPHILLSSCANLLSELCVDDMLDLKHAEHAEVQLTVHRARAVKHAEHALNLWPENSAAALTLAQLLREAGDLLPALDLYRDVAVRTVPVPSSGDGDKSSSYDWRREFIRVPHHHFCLPVALSNLAILLSQMGRHDEAEVAIGRLGCNARIDPAVWQCAHSDDEAAVSTTSKENAPARVYPRAIPKSRLAHLQSAFY